MLENLDDIREEIKSIEEEIEFFISQWNKRNEEKMELERIVNDKRLLNEAAFAGGVNQVREIAMETLENSVISALNSNSEFNGLGWESGLLAACNDPRSIGITGTSASDIKIHINLDLTAGTIEEYGNAVKAARGKINLMKSEKTRSWANSPSRASAFWKNFLYKVAREGMKTPTHYEAIRKQMIGLESELSRKEKKAIDKDDTAYWESRYWQTMNWRREAFQNPAPWWELLDKGSMGVEMPSDWGGTPYPPNSPTHFVTATIVYLENRAKKWIKDYTSRYRYDLWKSIKELEKRLEDYTEKIYELEKMIAILVKKLQAPEIATRLIKEQVLELQADKFNYIDPEKVKLYAEQLAQGVDIGRVTISSSGSDVSVRVRTELIRQRLEEELRKGLRR